MDFAMPIIKADAATGYTDSNGVGKVTISRPVRKLAGDVDGAWPGLDIHIGDLVADDALRAVYAMHKACLQFGYEELDGAGAPVDNSRIRAYLTFLPFGGFGQEMLNELRTLAVEGTESNIINYNFAFLQVSVYSNLDKTATRALLENRIRDAIGAPAESHNQWCLKSPLINHPAHNLRNFLDAGGTPDQYLNNGLFSEPQLRLLGGSIPGIGPPFLVSAGDAIGIIAHESAAVPATVGSCKLFLSMWDGAGNGLNPVYFLNALLRERAQVSFVNDVVEINKLGLDRILLIDKTPNDYDPPPTEGDRQEIHPVIWQLRHNSHNLFKSTAGTKYEMANFPPLFIPSSEPEVHDAAFAPIDVDAATHSDSLGLSNFHTFVMPIAAGGFNPVLSTLEWRVDKRGYVVTRFRGVVPENDWYWYFAEEVFGKVRKLWSRYGEEINRYCLPYGVPCELMVARIIIESGGNPNKVGLEPWEIPGVNMAIPVLPAAPGRGYMQLTHIPPPPTWKRERQNETVNMGALNHDINAARATPYHWNGGAIPPNLFNDLDTAPGIDNRVSPGLSQTIIGFIPGFLRIGGAYPPGIPAGFFSIGGVDVLAATPSQRFRWLIEPSHSICAGAGAFRFFNSRPQIADRSLWDPIYLPVAFNMGPGGLDHDDPGRLFGIHGKADLIVSRFLPYFNATVRLFERFELFTPIEIAGVTPGIHGHGGFRVEGNKLDRFSIGMHFEVIGSASNNRHYTVSAVTKDATFTVISVDQNVAPPGGADLGEVPGLPLPNVRYGAVL